MNRMAATGGIMLLLAGCYPAQQSFDQNSTAYNGQASAYSQPGPQASWQRYDGSPVWPQAAGAKTTASTNAPLFNNSPLSPYSATVRAPASSYGSTVSGMSTSSNMPTASNMATSSSFGSPSSLGSTSNMTAMSVPANYGASAPATSSTSAMPGMVAQADFAPQDTSPILKATAKSGPGRTAIAPSPLASTLESTPLAKENTVELPPIKNAPEVANPTTVAPVRQASWEGIHTSAKLTSSRMAAPAVRMVNNKRIQLNYKIEDMGPSGVGGVELWFTIDGRNWQKCASAAKIGSSCVTEVSEEGIYGFTLVARSGNGNAKEPPKTGDLPQVWVEVDLTAPTVGLNEVKTSTVDGTSHLNICWTASDRNLARRPITLSYAQTSTGPWTVVAQNLDNTGQYDWAVPANLPPKILIKVEACDYVGNVGAAQTREAIALDTAKPNVSILDVEAASK